MPGNQEVCSTEQKRELFKGTSNSFSGDEIEKARVLFLQFFSASM
jgi:hypothetical protein